MEINVACSADKYQTFQAIRSPEDCSLSSWWNQEPFTRSRTFSSKIFHKTLHNLHLFLIICYMEQNGRGVDCFCKSSAFCHGLQVCRSSLLCNGFPMQSAFHASTFRAVIQILCSFNIGAAPALSSLYVSPLCGRRSCPLNSVSRSCAVWLKLVVRAVFLLHSDHYQSLEKIASIRQLLSFAHTRTWSMMLPARTRYSHIPGHIPAAAKRPSTVCIFAFKPR